MQARFTGPGVIGRQRLYHDASPGTRMGEESVVVGAVRAAVEALPMAAWVVAADGGFLMGNRRWSALAGPGATAGPWAPTVHPDDAAGFAASWAGGLADGAEFTIAARIAAGPDGAWQLGRLTACPWQPWGGIETIEPLTAGWVVSWQPAPAPAPAPAPVPTEIPRSLTALAQAGVGLWYCNLGEPRVEMDPTCRAHFGFAADVEITWDAFFDRLHPDDLTSTRAAIVRAIEEGVPYDIEYRVIVPGEPDVRCLRAIGRKAEGAGGPPGAPVRFDGVAIDVTARKEVDRHVRQLAAVVDRSSELIGLAALDGTILHLNEAGLRLLGLDDVAAVRGRRVRDFVAADDRRRFLDEVVPAVARSGRWVGEFRLDHLGGGEPRSAWCDVFRVDDPDSGEPLCLAAVARDISEQKRSEQALRAARDRAEEASRVKDRFLAMLSHELRTPLTPVLLAAGELQADPSTPAAHREALDLIRQNVALEARLIDDLLDVSGVARTRPPAHREAVSTRSLLARVAEIVRPDVEAGRLDLIVDAPPGPDLVMADPARLIQVLWNILSNAVKFTPPGGVIHVGRAAHDGRLTIEVRDTGVGIDRAALPRIFNAFEQAEEDSIHRPGGLGLGLAISRSVIEALGGTLTAHSEGPGRGATFTVSLPLAASAATDNPGGGEAPAPSGEPPAGSPPEGEAAGYRLLFVEDDPMTARVMARLLRRCGYAVTAANTLGAALRAAASESFDLVVSDLGLPDGTGLDLMRFIRGRSDVPGIALTGYGTDDDLRRTVEAGFVAHLTKPVDFETLESMIRRVMQPLERSHPEP